MVNYREILRLHDLEYSMRQIASSVHSSRETIGDVCKLAKEKELLWPVCEEMTNAEILAVLYPDRIADKSRKMPDCSYMHKELAKSGVTLTLLWSEYCEEALQEKLIPYQYTQFCDHYRKYACKTKATMRIKRKPGEILEVDWAGDPLYVQDSITGEKIPAYLFVATLPCSLYSYAEVLPGMSQEHWINAHIHAYRYFGGSTRILVPDNTKTAVIKHGRSNVVLNRVYQEMAEHYNTAVIPARPRTPKDKASVEGTVGILSTWLTAALRNGKFFSFTELNEAVYEKLEDFNAKPFQKKKGSRLSAFNEEEKDYLQRLPASSYEMAVWSTAKIQPDYLITVEKNKYSVPYEYIGHTVDIRHTNKTIEVFFKSHRIASHVRSLQHCEPRILKEHMPEKHQSYLTSNRDTFLDWDDAVGPQTLTVMKSFLESVKVERQSFKTCSSLMRLADKYSVTRIETACERALSYTSSPSIRSIRTILKTGQDKLKNKQEPGNTHSSGNYGFTRGSAYYGGVDHD